MSVKPQIIVCVRRRSHYPGNNITVSTGRHPIILPPRARYAQIISHGSITHYRGITAGIQGGIAALGVTVKRIRNSKTTRAPIGSNFNVVVLTTPCFCQAGFVRNIKQGITNKVIASRKKE